jgi:hypothetical protein
MRRNVDEARLHVIELRRKLDDAKIAHRCAHPDNRTLNPQAQASLQKIAALDADLHWAERDVADMENAEKFGRTMGA